MKKMYLDKGTGYWVVFLPDGTRTTLHRLLMEQNIGRKLKQNEVVHHINEIKTDNRIENLEIKERGEHTSLHVRKSFTETHESRICAWCNKLFYVEKKYLRSKDRKTPYMYCSRSCGAKAQWKRQKLILPCRLMVG